MNCTREVRAEDKKEIVEGSKETFIFTYAISSLCISMCCAHSYADTVEKATSEWEEGCEQ